MEAIYRGRKIRGRFAEKLTKLGMAEACEPESEPKAVSKPKPKRKK